VLVLLVAVCVLTVGTVHVTWKTHMKNANIQFRRRQPSILELMHITLIANLDSA
jgi:hypothetical protein